MKVTVHLAQSLDGRIAIAGERTVLSTPEGKKAAHAARAENDAVLVGAGTVRVDDPRLSARHASGPDPLRVVLASKLDLPPSAKLFVKEERGGRVIVLGAEGRAAAGAREALEGRGAEVVLVRATAEGFVSLPEALAALEKRGVARLLVEGGARVLTSFFRERLVHRMSVEIATRMLGAAATPTVGDLAVGALDVAPRLANVSVERLGENVLLRGDVA